MDNSVSDEDAKKYAAAFASAPVVATVTVTDPNGAQKLEVRKSKDDTYAKSSQVEGVHKLTAADLTKFFEKKLDDFRAKKIFDFGFDEPNRIEVKDGAKTVSVEKTGDKWTAAGKTMDSGFRRRAARQTARPVRDQAGRYGIRHARARRDRRLQRGQAHREGPDCSRRQGFSGSPR